MLYMYIGGSEQNSPVGVARNMSDSGGLGCPASYHADQDWHDAFFRNLYEWAEASSALPDGVPGISYVSKGTTVPEPIVLDSFIAFRNKPKTSYKAFKAAKGAGKIILNPIEQADFSARITPGVLNPQPQGRIQRPVSPYPLVTYEEMEINPCNGYREPGYGIIKTVGGIPHIPVRVSAGTNKGALRCHYERYTGDLVLPPKEHAYDIARAIFGRVNQDPWSTHLITKVTAEANNGTWDIATEILEAKETISYVLGLLRSIVKLVRDTRKQIRELIRGKKKGIAAANLAEQIGSIWMQFRYAVTPLMFSVEAALDYAQTVSTPYQSYRAGKQTDFTISTTSGWSGEVSYIDRVFIKHQIDVEKMGAYALGTNIAHAVWQTTPLAFVVDWFLNIGNLLASLSTPSQAIQIGAQYSRQIRAESIVFTNPVYPGASIQINPAYYKADPFDPLLRVGVSFDVEMSFKRYIDAAVLTFGGLRKLLMSK